jgi:hypothetical protein
MKFAARQQTSTATSRRATTAHKCPQCLEQALVLQRRHVSPTQLGPTLVTEYYDCDCCDARYQFSPDDNRWKPLYQ